MAAPPLRPPDLEALARAHRQQLDRYVEVGPPVAGTALGFYYRMARQVLKQAQEFQEQGDLDRAYIFFKRFLRLAVDCIPDHMAYRDGKHALDKAWLVGERRQAMEALEAVTAAMDATMRAAYAKRFPQMEQQPVPAPTAKTAEAAATRTPEELDLERRLAALRDGDPLGASASRLLVESPLGEIDGDGDDDDGAPLQPLPSAPPLFDAFDDGAGAGAGAKEGRDDAYTRNPASVVDFETAFKSLRIQEGDKDKVGAVGGVRYYPALPASPLAKPAPPPPALPAAAVGGDEWFSRRAAMRPVVLASGLIGKFLEIAEPNSRQRPDGIETCGVLCGVQDKDGVRFTTLIIPKQEGTCNTVGTTHEEELYFYCEEHNLIQLGWIHTHPSQDCFMSSVDVHTHCAYQTMLPEAVAVVVSLKDARKKVGVFRLTEPGGLQLIQQCTLRGFHPHPVPDSEIYRDHHRVVWEDTGFLVVDQR